MSYQPLQPKDVPHLTPATLVGRRFGANTFQGITVALVGYCPRPRALDAYDPQMTTDQFFIHVPPGNVELCSYQGTRFLSIVHVYGGPVSSALIEELAYYGITHVLAYGLAGGLGTQGLGMGDFYLVERAWAADGTTPHYTRDRVIASNGALNARLRALAAQWGLPTLTAVRAMTGDAIYRESDAYLRRARKHSCDIVNCDSSHLFAVSREVGIRTTQCGVVSDVTTGDGDSWDSKLAAMLAAGGESPHDPLAMVGSVVELYVEALMPELTQR